MDELTQRDLAQLFAVSVDMLIVLDGEGAFRLHNPAVESILEFSAVELQGKAFLDFVYPADRNSTKETFFQLVDVRQIIAFEHRMKTKNNGFRWISWSGVFEPSTRYFYGTGRDVTSLKQVEKKLHDLSYVDVTTEIYNRRKFNEFIGEEWDKAKRYGKTFSIIMLDVDHFKIFNDFYGHIKGDELLKRIAQALQDKLRRVGDILCRYGGDEFVVVLPNEDSAGAQQCAQYLRDAILDLNVDLPDDA